MTLAGLRLGHVNIRTENLAETVAFYERVLGLRAGEAATNPDPAQNLWLFDDAGSPCVHVNQMAAGDVRSAKGYVDHFAFNCPDRAGMEQHLTTIGVAYVKVDFPAARMVQFNIYDPNGVKVELTFHDQD